MSAFTDPTPPTTITPTPSTTTNRKFKFKLFLLQPKTKVARDDGKPDLSSGLT